jgi:starch phosphorylase
VKFQKKKALAAYLKSNWGFDIDPTTMFDIQIKRIHECAHSRQALQHQRALVPLFDCCTVLGA